MPKILCLDDTPDSPEIANKTLREVLGNIYQSTPYEVIFETYGEKGVEAAKGDRDIKLVLLDIEFAKQKKQGDEIAKDLRKVRRDLKVIVLTRQTDTGHKISLGWKRNVVHYVIKKLIHLSDIQRKMRSLSRGVIEDPQNREWKLEYDGAETITLIKGAESYGINLPITGKQAIIDCINVPNKAVPISLASDQMNKARNNINNNVREGTDWKMWGILSKEDCAKGQLRLVIGTAELRPPSRVVQNGYISKSHFDEFKKEVERRLSLLEQFIRNLTSSGNE
jgi:CheY-like chemotaxis protein